MIAQTTKTTTSMNTTSKDSATVPFYIHMSTQTVISHKNSVHVYT